MSVNRYRCIYSNYLYADNETFVQHYMCAGTAGGCKAIYSICTSTGGMNIKIYSICIGTADVCTAIPVCRYCRCVYSHKCVQVAQMSVQQYSVCLQVLRCAYSTAISVCRYCRCVYSNTRLQVLQVCTAKPECR